MRLTKLFAAAAALSLAATPALAQSAAPLSVVGSAAPASVDLAQSGDRQGGLFGDYGFAIAFFAVAIGLVFLIGDDDSDGSTSP